MRESGQQYKMADGSLQVLVCACADVPKDAVLWNGYDYQEQLWVIDGVAQWKGPVS